MTEQGTSLWHDSRAKGIGGSEVAIILGLSPYRTPYSLWLEKTRREQPEDISALPHVQRGIMGEKVCRMMLEQEHGTLFKPKTWQSKDCEWHRCSDDGYSLDLEVLLEIKAMGAKPHEVMAEAAKTNDLSGIPEHYYPQCQWNLMVSGAKECWFISFRPEDNSMHRVVVTPDPAYWKKLRKAVDEFWLVNVKKDIPPALTDKDYKPISTPEYAALAEEYVRLKAEIKEREERLENLKAKLESFVGTHPAITGHGLKIRRYVREGAVDYSKVPALSGVDLGQYRKPGSVVTEIRLAAV